MSQKIVGANIWLTRPWLISTIQSILFFYIYPSDLMVLNESIFWYNYFISIWVFISHWISYIFNQNGSNANVLNLWKITYPKFLFADCTDFSLIPYIFCCNLYQLFYEIFMFIHNFLFNFLLVPVFLVA